MWGAPSSGSRSTRWALLGTDSYSHRLHYDRISHPQVRLDADALQQQTDGDIECIICLSDMEPSDQLVCLPCSSEKAKSHLFHADCLARWLLTSAACPTCRRPVRSMLTKARACAHVCR